MSITPSQPRALRPSTTGARSLLLAGLLAAGGGCELFGEKLVQVDIFSAHYGSPVDGAYPEFGVNGGPRSWVNDQGWSVDILDGYFVITGVSLVECDGTTRSADMVFGPAPEHISFTDRDVLNVASITTPEGDYCRLLVQYGPYRKADADAVATPIEIPTAVDLEGVSVLLSGVARKGDVQVGFLLTSSGTRAVEVDLQKAGAGALPYTIAADGGDPRVTVGKAYDAFFHGVDFATLDEEALSGQLLTSLASVTAGYHGTDIY
jgi:hypothetical protein